MLRLCGQRFDGLTTMPEARLPLRHADIRGKARRVWSAKAPRLRAWAVRHF
jgi:hypothetical protein